MYSGMGAWITNVASMLLSPISILILVGSGWCQRSGVDS